MQLAHRRLGEHAKITVPLRVFHQGIRADDGAKTGCPLPSSLNTAVCLVFVGDALIVVVRAGDGWLFSSPPVDDVADTAFGKAWPSGPGGNAKDGHTRQPLLPAPLSCGA